MQRTRAWHGTRVVMGYVEEAQSYATAEIWMSLPDELVVHHETFPGPSQPVSQEFIAAVRAARPARLRVSDAEWAADLRRALPDFEVEVGPTPRLNALTTEMRNDMGGRATPYLHSDIDAPNMASLFRAAAALYGTRPWKHAEDWQTIRVDIPALGVHGHCLSIIGALGESFGFILFESLESFDRMVESSDELQRGAGFDVGADFLALNYERGAELHNSLRKEIRRHHWEVAGAHAYPVISHHSGNGFPVRETLHDVKVIRAVAESLAACMVKHADWFDEQDGAPICESWFDADDLEVRFTMPAEAGYLFPANLPGAGSDAVADAYARLDPLHDLHEKLTQDIYEYAWESAPSAMRKSLAGRPSDAEGLLLSELIALYHTPAEGVSSFAAAYRLHGQANQRERDWIDAQCSAWLSIWQVISSGTNCDVTLLDRLTGTECVVLDPGLAAGADPGSSVLARIVNTGDIHAIFGSISLVADAETGTDLEARARRYLRRKGPVDPARLQEPRVMRRLVKLWKQTIGDDIPGPISARVRDQEGSADPVVQSELPIGEDELDALAVQYKTEHYERWVDEAIPALGNRTPRAAARTVEGRRELSALIDDMERLELRLDATKRYDFGILRQALGLDAD